jgi:quercetin dioxygenase-like cupin family protein
MDSRMKLNERLVRYDDLKPCHTAFIDTRSPGSDKKENFTIIGPGVAENPDQHVHISIPHGFNIGGARQPPHCLNSQHSHLTNEVFVVHTGTWAFRSGVDAKDGEIILKSGDVISLPTDIFRGFENIGQNTGFLYAVLGEDDPGRVLWAPQVFDLAADHGLILMEDGSLVDTLANETPPEGVSPMPRTSSEQITAHQLADFSVLKTVCIRSRSFDWMTGTALAAFDGVEEAPLLGPGNELESIPDGRLCWSHGFVMRALKMAPGSKVPTHIRQEEEVIFVHQGELIVEVDDKPLELKKGDTFTTPIGSKRSFSNQGKNDCIVYITRRTDQPQAPEFI